jgi:hypothetical protein
VAWAYVIKNVWLHTATTVGEFNFPKFDGPVPDLAPFNRRIVSASKVWEDREAREWLKTERAIEEYLVEFHHRYLERFKARGSVFHDVRHPPCIVIHRCSIFVCCSIFVYRSIIIRRR